MYAVANNIRYCGQANLITVCILHSCSITENISSHESLRELSEIPFDIVVTDPLQMTKSTA